MAKKLEDKVKVMLPTPDFVAPQVITVSKSEFKKIEAEHKMYKTIGHLFLAAIAIAYIATGEAARCYNTIKNHDWKVEYQNFKGFPQP